MSGIGFNAAKQRVDQVIARLRTISYLIGEPNGHKLESSTGESLIAGLNMIDEASALDRRAADLSKGTFRILVMGEFKNGKSTTLNAMLAEDILPAKVTPATAVITVIVGGDSKAVNIYERNQDGDFVTRTLDVNTFKSEFTITKNDQETLKNKNQLDRFSRVEFVEMESNYQLVQNNVSLIDSPGLGERESRSKVTRNYLQQVQAIIFVLRADRILSEDERNFLADLGTNRLEHVFILVNRINLVPEDEVDEVKEFVKEGLEEYFCQPNSQAFDQDLYNRRIFYINAKGAFRARTGAIADEEKAEEALQKSGLLAFEKELEQFLTSEERFQSALSTTMYVVSGLSQKAVGRIKTILSAYETSLPELRNRRERSELELKILENDKREIEAQVRKYGSITAEKVYKSLETMVDGLSETWEHDSQTIIKLDKVIKIGKLTKGVFSQKSKDEINEAINDEIQKYVELKFGDWQQKEAEKHIRNGMEEMGEDLKLELESFENRLNDVARYFSYGSSLLPEGEKGTGKAVKLGLLVGYFLFVPGGWHDAGMMGTMMLNEFNLRDFLRQLGRQIGIIIGTMVVAAIFGGPVAWVALFGSQIISGASAAKDTKNKIRKKIGEEITSVLKDEVSQSEDTIKDDVKKIFEKTANEINESLQKDIDSVRQDQDDIIAQLEGEESALERERVRLALIRNKLEESIGDISEITYGKRLNWADIENISRNSY